MSSRENRCVVLNRGPTGVPDPECFDIVTRPVAGLQDSEFLVHNAYLSVDPAQRGWVNDAPKYSPPVPVGDVMRANAVGNVVESRHADFAVGNAVCGRFGWQRSAVSDDGSVLRTLSRDKVRQCQEWDPLPNGPRIHRQLLVARARMTGFLVHDFKGQVCRGHCATYQVDRGRNDRQS